MYHIYLSRSGTLKAGVVYQLRIADHDLPPNDGKDQVIFSPRVPKEDELTESVGEEYVRAEIAETPKVRQTSRCRLDPSHHHERFATELKFRLFGGPRYAQFIHDGFAGHYLVSSDFRIQLGRSGLTGLHLEPVEIVAREAPSPLKEVFAIQPTGRACDRGMTVQNAPNACPHCGKGYIFCPACGFQVSTCPYCDGIMWNLAKNIKPGEKTLIICPIKERQPPILNGKDWDGSDFIQGRYRNECYITKRALDWMLSVHAAPFFAVPVLIDVDGMSAQQMKWLEQAQDLASLGG